MCHLKKVLLRNNFLEITDKELQKLNDFKDLVLSGNEVINLTSNLSIENFNVKNILDSLLVHKFPEFKKSNVILDVGTGAGLPGIPLSILNEDKKFILIDTRIRRINFLEKVVKELELKNVKVIKKNVANYNEAVDLILYKAVGKLDYLLPISNHLLKNNSISLFYKGKNFEEELKEVENKGYLKKYNFKNYRIEKTLLDNKYERNFLFFKHI